MKTFISKCHPIKEAKIICFSANTLVALPGRSCKEIAKIRAGDCVLGFDQFSGAPMSVRVETVASSFHSRHVILALEDSTRLACTHDHPLWVDGKGWCAVEPGNNQENYDLATKCLSQGDRFFVLRDGLLKTVALQSMESVVIPSRMWVIGTGTNHTFFANHILAHDENVGVLDLTRVDGVSVTKFREGSYPEPVPA